MQDNIPSPRATTAARLRHLQGTDAEWAATDPVLLDGEPAFSSDLKRFKVGPGLWSSLKYWGDPDAPQDGFPYAFQDGQWIKTTAYLDFTGDLNTISRSGITHYRLVEPVTNAWFDYAAKSSFVTHMEYDTNEAIQIGYAYNEPDETTHVTYQRVRRGGVWGQWYTNAGYSPQPFVADLNDLASGGTFQLSFPLGNGVTNAWPSAGFGDIIQHTNINGTTAMQVGFELRAAGEPQIWMRSLASGVWLDWVENKFGFEVSESDIADLNRVRWRNAWLGGTEYVKNDMVVSSGYLAVANTTTSDSPVPDPSGDAVFQLPTVPSWATDTYTGVFEGGQRYTVPSGSLYRVQQYRFWVPTGCAVANYSYALFVIDEADPTNLRTELVVSVSGDQVTEGWNTYDNLSGSLLSSGSAFAVYLQSINSASNTTWNADWTREGDSNANPPSEGFWLTNANDTAIRFNMIDLDTTNQSTNLGLVTAGTDILVIDTADGGANIYQQFRVTDVTDNGTWWEFAVVSLETGPGGSPGVGAACTATFTIPVAAGTQYTSIADYYASDPYVSGVYSEGDTGAVQNQDAYGVDIQVLELTASPDWDIAAITEGGVLGGVPGEGGSGGSAVWYGDNEPSEAIVGDLWYRSLNPTGLFVKTDDGDSEQWVQTNGVSVSGDYLPRDGTLPMLAPLPTVAATADAHAPTWGQVKAQVGDYLPLTGGTLSGALNINGDGVSADGNISASSIYTVADSRVDLRLASDGIARIASERGDVGRPWRFVPAINGAENFGQALSYDATALSWYIGNAYSTDGKINTQAQNDARYVAGPLVTGPASTGMTDFGGDDLNNAVPAYDQTQEIFRITASATLNNSIALSNGDFIIAMNHQAGVIRQIAHQWNPTGEQQPMWWRDLASGVWTDWAPLGSGGLYNDVSHDPAGAASWRVIGDTLECWGQVSVSGSQTITFPKTFQTGPRVTMTAIPPNHTNGIAYTADMINVTTTQFTARVATVSAGLVSDASRPIHYHAIGQWNGV